MTRGFRLVLSVLVIASLVVAVGALGLRWREAGEFAAIFSGPKPARPILLLAMPVLLTGLLVFIELEMIEEKRAHLSRERRIFINFTLATQFAFLVGIQAWQAAVYLGPVRPDPEFVVRLLSVFAGLAMAVRGNFLAKLPSPSADKAGDFARTSRRTALILVLMGLALASCAAALPMKALLAALAGVFVALLVLTSVQRWATVRL
jgi:hypothetical protein